MEPFGLEDHAAASMVAALGSKRSRDEDSPDAAGGFNPEKIARLEQQLLVEDNNNPVVAGPPLPLAAAVDADADADDSAIVNAALKPYPFFLYSDFSNEKDPDPLTPLTPPGRVPNFPAKMHSILSRDDLADIICWMPHGRSWRVLKPREFEVKVIPTYFEHAKFSSFIRQANGWGFRRITQGRDRNSYYHELFLRGLPHLCKKMKRPGVAEKQAADPEHEPDLYKISELHPVPAKCDDDSILLQCTLQGGPKARMPIYTGVLSSSSSLSGGAASFSLKPPAAIPGFPTTAAATGTHLTPRDQEALNAFQQSLGASEDQFKNLALSSTTSNSSIQPHQQIVLPPSTFAATGASTVGQPQQQQQPPSMNFTHFLTAAMPATSNDPTKTTATAMTAQNPLATANQLAFANANMAAAFQAITSAASQFAAGFAAATALTHYHATIRRVTVYVGHPVEHTPTPYPHSPTPTPYLIFLLVLTHHGIKVLYITC